MKNQSQMCVAALGYSKFLVSLMARYFIEASYFKIVSYIIFFLFIYPISKLKLEISC